MIPSILHQVWLGDSPLPPFALRWREEIHRLHPSWNYRLWTEDVIHDLPGAELLDRCKSQSARSNIVRLAVVLVHGGIYLDCDCEVIRPLDGLLCLEAFVAPEKRDRRLCNAVFGATRNHPWIRWQLDNLPAFVDRRGPWGPHLMGAAPRKGLTVLPPYLFYPFLWDAPPERRQPASESYLVHHWHWAMTRKGDAHHRVHPEPDVPMHSYRADYERLLWALRPQLVVEWGPGPNTQMALAVGAEVFSIEHDPQWMPKDLSPKLAVLLAPKDGKHYCYFPAEADLYFIDGRNRARCLELVYDRAHPDAVVCLHDAQRRAYRSMLLRFPYVLEPSMGFAIATKAETVAACLAELFETSLRPR
jgi:hypothetical protein